MSDEAITVTLVFTETGQSESIPVQANETTVKELTEWGAALFGLDSDVAAGLSLYKDGAPLPASLKSRTLHVAGIKDGDMIALVSMGRGQNNNVNTNSSSSVVPPSAAPQGTGMLDFSSLLGQAANSSSSNTGLPPLSSLATSSSSSPDPVYFHGMGLDEAAQYNRHPVALVTLLRSKDHLFKEFHYHNPLLATQIQSSATIEEAANVYRQSLVKGGIENAMRESNQVLQRQTMQRRLDANPSDEEAFEFFAQEGRQKLIHEQYRHVMEEYPESFGRVLMLYISATINGHAVQAFCDSGAQMTVMNKKMAVECGIADMIDTRFKGIAVGVGTGAILGRIHMVQLKIGTSFFPCTVTVMDDPKPGSEGKSIGFLLGLDMMKRHMCSIDLERGCLRFRLGADFMEAPFLHEKDLTEEQGGTRGFNADKANQEHLASLLESSNDKNDGDNDEEMD